MAPVPTVLYPLTLHGLVSLLCTTQKSALPTNIIMCTSQPEFLQELSESVSTVHGNNDGRNELQQLIAPTLFNLSTSQHIRLTFCASVQALLAYLTAYGQNEARRKERVVLVNPVALHVPNPSFSAQGLSRTFAAATEMALRTGVVFHVVECYGKKSRVEDDRQSDDAEDGDVEMDHGEEEGESDAQYTDPWEQELSILNVSARKFGSSTTERSWAGRTVKAKRIAGRFFQFHQLKDVQAQQAPE